MKQFGIILILTIQVISGLAQSTDDFKSYFAFPKYKKQHAFSAGVSITRLPSKIVEEEISTLPMANLEYRLGLFRNLTLHAQLNTNYINNLGGISFQWTFLNRGFTMGIGENSSVWYGRLQQESFRLQAIGILLRPYVTMGIDFEKFIIIAAFETQYGFMNTYSDNVFVGRSRQPHSAYTLRVSIEQPLWNNHWVSLGTRLNYAKFFYQSWVAYSTLNEYLFYPEFSFSFIL